MAALACEADFVFIPEDPVPNNWPEKLCKKILQVRSPALSTVGKSALPGNALVFLFVF